ncbi:MAG: uncharacterized protein KVP18_000023 [Porospora cf. gigantea A]|uniref:uncharacterized protein n=1 Tax=Porospora cf. gigantea A TaxID=2853593 RepID=UPI003559C13F|nr:MAG: hypothetical protein KVP18_000023 [Porospora cf. gigantea A]
MMQKVYPGDWNGRKVLCKERVVKNYRHPDLDRQLTQHRMLQEVRNARRLRTAGVDSPFVYFADFTKRVVFYEFIEGATVQQYLESCTDDQAQTTFRAIGVMLARMHGKNLIHGDLTTANLMVRADENGFKPSEVCVIDLGLSYTSTSTEDKAVDLFVLKKAFLSAHGIAHSHLLGHALLGYRKHSEEAANVLSRLEVVELRGRKRSMVG